MIRLHQPAPNTKDCPNAGSRPWSLGQRHRLLKRVVGCGGADDGRRVLVVGLGCVESMAWLESLGWEAVLWDEVTGRSRAALTGSRWNSSSGKPFDLILADADASRQDNLLELSVRSRTAHLLSQLRPSGQLLIVSPQQNGPPSHLSVSPESTLWQQQPVLNGHSAACWTRHLACFPGQLELIDSASGQLTHSVWRWLIRADSHASDIDRSQPVIVSLRVPVEPLTAGVWLDHARRGLLTGTTCCKSAALAGVLQLRVA